MFERNKVDNSTELTSVPVEIGIDGETAKGKLWIARSRTLSDVLNGPTQFLDFESYDGARALIAKAAVRSVKLAPVPNAPNLQARVRDDSFDPYTILGVQRGARWEEIRSAFLARAKAYHPDRYANAELPDEVCDYLAVMARRINAAYAALEDTEQKAVAVRAGRAEPIYSSAPRA